MGLVALSFAHLSEAVCAQRRVCGWFLSGHHLSGSDNTAVFLVSSLQYLYVCAAVGSSGRQWKKGAAVAGVAGNRETNPLREATRWSLLLRWIFLASRFFVLRRRRSDELAVLFVHVRPRPAGPLLSAFPS